jgi:hypothetical protein
MDLVETLKGHLERWKQRPYWHDWAKVVAAAGQAIDAYHALSQEQARELADYALAMFDASRGKDEDKDLAREMLGDLAIFIPGSLRGIYPQLIVRELFWPGQMYLRAGAAARDQLIALLEETTEYHYELYYALTSLAWIGDETVQMKFSAWRQQPPVWWAKGVDAHGLMEAYIREAGWELTSEGKRRDLCYQQWRQLLPMKQAHKLSMQTPASAGSLHDAPCQWCGLKMAYIIDLDLRDPQLAFLGLPGGRLRIPFCEWCSLGTVIYSDIDFSGAAHWSTANGPRPEHISNMADNKYDPGWKEVRYVPGPLSDNPYEPLFSCVTLDRSRLGSLPQWVQYPEYPSCPGCHQSMRCLGQFDPGDMMQGGDEGWNYAFICVECGKAAVCHQQT